MSLQIVNKLILKAKQAKAKILFPETNDSRTLTALKTILNKKICQPVLIGKKISLARSAKKFGFDLSKCLIIDSEDQKLRQKLALQLYHLRKAKGVNLKNAAELLKDLNYFATMLLQTGFADGIVSGAASTTADTLRPAFQIIRTKPGKALASGAFLMIFKKRPPMIFADCAVNIRPSASDLATIAIETSETANFLGLKPKVALLSFSTHGSSRHPEAIIIHQAAQILKKRAPHLISDGELQADAALVASVAHFKSSRSKIQGNANILIFPSLETGNIAYKLVERLAGADAIGTIIQGLKKPVNDLSRGCKPSDIVTLAAITALQTSKK